MNSTPETRALGKAALFVITAVAAAVAVVLAINQFGLETVGIVASAVLFVWFAWLAYTIELAQQRLKDQAKRS